MRKRLLNISLFILMAAVAAPEAGAQLSPSLYDYPQNHLQWYTIESDHFLVHFQEGNSRTAKVASRIAEEIYPYITGLYDHRPSGKTSIVLDDRADYSNGAAYFFDNQIRIWVPALETPLRGTHNWMRDVITHEFTHIVQLEASMKKSRAVPAIYLQWLSYEDVRRPDVLYGYPKGIITHPFATVSIPAWFAEGTAQYQREGWFYDTWDTHRDMVLRVSMLDSTYLNFDEMGVFSSKTSLEREKVYNQGFAFTGYLVRRFGEEVLSDITWAFSRTGVFTADEALKIATGISGKRLFDRWAEEQQQFYSKAVAAINRTETAVLEDEGFFNFYPARSPDGSTIAYLSNKGRDESSVSLYLIDAGPKGEQLTSIDLGTPLSGSSLSCGYGVEAAIDKINSSFSFSPGGKEILYSRSSLNRYGERYSDLYLRELESGDDRRISRNGRLSSPAWHPELERAVAVQQQYGTANLVLVDLEKGDITPLTNYNRGEQVYTPAWHPDGNTVYFGYSEQMGRSIKKIDVDSGTITSVIENGYIDFRDPYIDREGLFLYYASDADGIFNIYRKPLGGGPEQKLSNVTGGAFMPHLGPNGRLLVSEYREGGYKISSFPVTPAASRIPSGSYSPDLALITTDNQPAAAESAEINAFDDTDIEPFTDSVFRQAEDGQVIFELRTEGSADEREFYEYEEAFTGMSFYPIIRFDNYSKPEGSNGRLIREGNFAGVGQNLLRDLKIGTYFSSREVIGRLSIFGGALFGPASLNAEGIGDFFKPSRLSDLDRDLFLITEYRGLPFIKKRWSPTISIELYNLRRNVKNGLAIEEFPCTSCLPDTLNTDIAYNIWEADFFLRSKIDESNLLELGIGYTPYKVQTEGFFSRELQQFIPPSSSEYFRGTTLSATHVYEWFKPYRHADVAPVGIRTYTRYAYEIGKLLDEYEISDGALSPVYKTNRNHSVEFNTRAGLKVTEKSVAQLYARFFSQLNNPDDSFYTDYFGGFTGMRSYPYFALGGNTTAFGQLSYIFPLATGISKQFGRYTFDKLFLRLFTEAGKGWDNPLQDDTSLRSGIGAELRFSFNSYYLFPLKLFVSSAYGFNRFDVTLPDEFITETPSGKVTYGRELLFHFGLTFDFNILNND